LVSRSAWCQPVSDVVYEFNEEEFPAMPKKQDTDTNTPASLSHISSNSKQHVKNAIGIETKKMQVKSKCANTVIKAHFKNMDNSLQALATQLVQNIFAQLIRANSPFVASTQLDQKLDRISQQIDKLTNGPSSQSPSIRSPPQKQT
jgi:hypothetical protein